MSYVFTTVLHYAICIYHSVALCHMYLPQCYTMSYVFTPVLHYVICIYRSVTLCHMYLPQCYTMSYVFTPVLHYVICLCWFYLSGFDNLFLEPFYMFEPIDINRNCRFSPLSVSGSLSTNSLPDNRYCLCNMISTPWSVNILSLCRFVSK